jgi:hypothetical protein
MHRCKVYLNLHKTNYLRDKIAPRVGGASQVTVAIFLTVAVVLAVAVVLTVAAGSAASIYWRGGGGGGWGA